MSLPLRIHTTQDPEVRQISTELSKADILEAGTQQFFNDLIEVMLKYDGIGIAAPQVGKTICTIVIEKQYTESSEHLILVNPRVVSTSKKTVSMEEGCLSVPNITGDVERPTKARIKALDKKGNMLDIKARGMLARVLQHEIDHLNGILFIDKASETFKKSSLIDSI